VQSKSSGKSAAEKNEEYLQRLEHKNRLKKNLSIKNSSEKQAEDRERGGTPVEEPLAWHFVSPL
jgi:hypothetical protein